MMLNHILKIKDRVAYILMNFPDTRDCDKKLWLQYLIHFHQLDDGLGEAKLAVFKNILLSNNTPTMESVRRVRQKYQECGKYEASENTRMARHSEEQKVRHWAIEG